MLGSVRIANTSNCTIYLGPCCTSVYLENCTGCTIFIACHQLRIHETNDCRLYVRVNSHPIIEDCSNLGFAPYSFSYSDIETDFEVSHYLLCCCLLLILSVCLYSEGSAAGGQGLGLSGGL